MSLPNIGSTKVKRLRGWTGHDRQKATLKRTPCLAGSFLVHRLGV
jgi:hypothetical protein